MSQYAAWPLPLHIFATLRAVSVTLRGGENGDNLARIQRLQAAVIQEVEHATRRQFVPDVEDTTRTYDGNGTPELEVDEMVSLTSVSIIGSYSSPSYDLTDAQLIDESGRPKTRIVVGRGSLPAFPTYAVMQPIWRLFPAGRQNVQVTGRFGYGAEVPYDLWEAVAQEVALRATREALFAGNSGTSQDGTPLPPGARLTEERYGDEVRKYALDEGMATGWHDAFCRVIGTSPGGYRRPQGRKLRKMRGEMID